MPIKDEKEGSPTDRAPDVAAYLAGRLGVMDDDALADAIETRWPGLSDDEITRAFEIDTELRRVDAGERMVAQAEEIEQLVSADLKREGLTRTPEEVLAAVLAEIARRITAMSREDPTCT